MFMKLPKRTTQGEPHSDGIINRNALVPFDLTVKRFGFVLVRIDILAQTNIVAEFHHIEEVARLFVQTCLQDVHKAFV